jgi:CubicO group peptidase (beta-lactamase class C family)
MKLEANPACRRAQASTVIRQPCLPAGRRQPSTRFRFASAGEPSKINMKQLLFILAVSLATMASAQENTEPADKRFAGLDTAFARIISLWKDAGFSVAVVEKNKVVYAKGFGYRNLEQKLPATPNTLYAIGSCTKAFTASLIGELESKGKLDIDKPVRNYLPELRFYNDEMNDQITLRDMMCHRTGLPRHDYSWYLFSTSSRDSLLKRVQYQEPSARPREKWQYNNWMFMLQGMVIEKITGQSWESNIKSSIFQPLGMTHSNLTIADLEKDPEAATGYNVKDSAKTETISKTDYYHIDAMGPAGAINSSVADMSIWLKTWIYGGRFNGKEIIPSAFAKEAISSQMIIGSGLPDSSNRDILFSTYGFGWAMSSYRGHYRVEHGGNIDGFSASTCFFPSDSIGIVVLSNQNNSVVPSIIQNIISDRMLGLKYYDWNYFRRKDHDKMKQAQADAAGAKLKSETVKTSASHPLRDYTGLFNNKGYGTMDVYLRHDSLFMYVGKDSEFVKQDKYDWFKVYDIDKKGIIDTSDGFSIEFRTSANGEINELNASFERSVKTIVFTRIPKIAMVSAGSLKKFEGDYLIAQLELKVFVKNEALHLSVPGQPEYELVPIEENKFVIKDMTGFTLTFEINDKNEVTGLTSAQPNGTFKAVKKL